MSNLHDFVHRCARELCGVACIEHAAFTQLELRSALNPEVVHLTVKVTPLDDTAEAAVSGHTSAGELRTNTVSHRDWQTLSQLIVEALPAELFEETSLNATFTGQWADGSDVPSAHGDSLTNTITPDNAAKEATVSTLNTTPGVENLFDLAVTTAIDFVTAGDGQAQVHVTAGKAFTWVTVGKSFDRDRNPNGWYAQTNDMDFMVGIPPTLNAHSSDPAALKDEILAYLRDAYAGVSKVAVEVFRRPVKGFEPVLEGDSDTGELRQRPELPSL